MSVQGSPARPGQASTPSRDRGLSPKQVKWLIIIGIVLVLAAIGQATGAGNSDSSGPDTSDPEYGFCKSQVQAGIESSIQSCLDGYHQLEDLTKNQ